MIAAADGLINAWMHVPCRAAKLAHDKTIKIKGFPKDHKMRPFRVVLSTHRTEWVVTNDALRSPKNPSLKTVHTVIGYLLRR